MQFKDILLGIFVAFMWGTNFTAQKYFLSCIPPFFSSFIRIASVSIILLPFIKWSKKDLKQIFILSMFYAVGFISCASFAIYLGSNTTLVTVLAQSATPFTIIMAGFLLNETISLQKFTGMIISAIGAYIVVDDVGFIANQYAVILVLLATFFLATYSVLLKKFKLQLSQISIFGQVCFFGSFFLLCGSYFMNESIDISIITKYHIIALIYSIIGPTILAFIAWGYLLKKYDTNKVSPFFLLMTVFGSFSNNIILGEYISIMEIFGAVIVISGMYLIISNKNFLVKT